ncbi:TIGR03088 family PEP-CTERM/XrtA system glycosyltransferase [Dyella sp. A6]|uniref:TIGR03088 family PEP-CTERM/XrtA system glycosyltransferase n=1 Tax=Dyella aluminiiresistens TaxID=3069105 RepID=UPI002E7A5492|nr:TIGR03088 family PEP-CTERM/XrtA system glycosyltransferase [Dyella sp. A6]
MSDKPLIVHVLYRFDTGGMEQIMLSMIDRTRERYRHAVICVAGYGPLRDRLEAASVPCLSLDKKPGKDFLHYLRFWRALRSLKPDLVHTYNIGTLDLTPFARLAGVRRVIHAEHGRDSSDPLGEIRKYRRLRRWMAPFINRYVPVSVELRDWLTQRVGIRPSKVLHIPNGIDVDRYGIASSQRASRRLTGNLAPPGTLLVGNVARLDKVKDHAALISAFGLLREQAASHDVDCRLVIAGDGPQRAVLEQQIVELGLTESVHLLGNRDDVPELLAECDLFVLSSMAEGMPLTLLEAMAAGLPVVTTRVGDTASMVEADRTGVLVPPGDPQALAEAMRMYAIDEPLRRQHGEAGRARVVARFSLGTMVAAYEALFAESLAPVDGALVSPASGFSKSRGH